MVKTVKGKDYIAKKLKEVKAKAKENQARNDAMKETLHMTPSRIIGKGKKDRDATLVQVGTKEVKGEKTSLTIEVKDNDSIKKAVGKQLGKKVLKAYAKSLKDRSYC